MNIIKSILLTALLSTTSVFAGPCQNDRAQIIESVKSFLKKEYGPKIARNSQVYPIMGTDRARVRSYPDNKVCMGEFCIDSGSCSVQECDMKMVTQQGIQNYSFSCWNQDSND